MPGQEALFDDLYRELILEHHRSPRHRGSLEHPTHRAEGLNPTCGDEVRIEAELENGAIKDVAFEGQGCSISQASSSMLSDIVTGKAVTEALEIARKFDAMLVKGDTPAPEIGDLEAFQGVAKFHARIKCATLASKVLAECLESPVGATSGG